MARLADVVKDGSATQLAGIVDHEIAEAKQSLRNTGGNRDILNFREGNVSSRASD